MSDQISTTLASMAEHLSALEQDFLQVGRLLEGMDEARGRPLLLAVQRAIGRVAESARAVKSKCPRCKRPDAKMEYEAVNKLSGVWTLPECPTCRELVQVVVAVEKATRATAPAGG